MIKHMNISITHTIEYSGYLSKVVADKHYMRAEGVYVTAPQQNTLKC